jgi:DNA-binding IclR family transcriptional regulator
MLDSICASGYESIPSVQVRGLYAISFPILDTQGRAIAALTVPYAERIDQSLRKSVPEVTETLRAASQTLSARIGGGGSASKARTLDASIQRRPLRDPAQTRAKP